MGRILVHATNFFKFIYLQTHRNVSLYETIFRTFESFKKINGSASRGGAQS
jgi:hypothetical protein